VKINVKKFNKIYLFEKKLSSRNMPLYKVMCYRTPPHPHAHKNFHAKSDKEIESLSNIPQHVFGSTVLPGKGDSVSEMGLDLTLGGKT
jgi:hypothetical protein